MVFAVIPPIFFFSPRVAIATNAMVRMDKIEAYFLATKANLIKRAVSSDWLVSVFVRHPKIKMVSSVLFQGFRGCFSSNSQHHFRSTFNKLSSQIGCWWHHSSCKSQWFFQFSEITDMLFLIPFLNDPKTELFSTSPARLRSLFSYWLKTQEVLAWSKMWLPKS